MMLFFTFFSSVGLVIALLVVLDVKVFSKQQDPSQLRLWLHRRGFHYWRFVDRYEDGYNPMAYYECRICGKTETALAYNALT